MSVIKVIEPTGHGHYFTNGFRNVFPENKIKHRTKDGAW